MKTKPALIAFLILCACFFSYGCKKQMVTYDGNGATAGSVPEDTAKYKKGSTVTVLGNTGSLAKTDFDFAGWNTAADGSGISYGQGGSFEIGTEDVTLFAKWTQEVTYTVVYDGNGANGGNPPVDTTHYTEGATVTVLGAGSLVKEGHVLTGWDTADDGTGTGYAQGETFVMGTANVTLYAVWAVDVNRTVTYSGNGANGGSPPADLNTYLEGDNVTVLGNTADLVKEGYTFAGWNTVANGSGQAYSAGARFGQAKFTMGTANVLLHAQWASRWTTLIGGPGEPPYAEEIAVDVDGNSYIGGFSEINLHDQTKTGDTDIFVMKHDATGARLWTRMLGAPGVTAYGWGLAIDAEGNSYVMGDTYGSLDNQTKTGTPVDTFVAKYDTDGVKQWTRLLGVSGQATEGKAVAADAQGNCYVTGKTRGELDGEALTGTVDLFVTKYDTAGVKKWTRLLGAENEYSGATGIAVDKDGNCYITGGTTAALDNQTQTGTEDVFVTKYDASGERLWTRQLGAVAKASYSHKIAVDQAGNSYSTGYSFGSFDNLPVSGDYDGYIVKHDPAGAKQWTRLIGTAGATTEAYGIAADEYGNSYVTGFTYGGLYDQPHIGTYDVFLIKYDASGTRLWNRQMGVSGEGTYGYQVALDANGTCFVMGQTDGPLDNQTMQGSEDIFITTKLNK